MHIVHWAACGFYFIARQEHLSSSTWFMLFPTLIATWSSLFDAYIFSRYWSLTTFATVGYGARALKHAPVMGVLPRVENVPESDLNPH